VLGFCGTRVRCTTLDSGTVFCPGCGGDRRYRRRFARRWLAVFGVAVLPLAALAEVIECDGCGGTYGEEVLAEPTSGQLTAILQQAMRALVTAVLRAGDPTEDRARALAVAAVAGVGATGFDDAALARALATVPADVSAYLRPLADQLEVAGREALLARAVTIAAAGGPLSESQRATLRVVGAALELSPAHVHGVVDIASRAHD
jgi:uncharacterized membrane protein